MSDLHASCAATNCDELMFIPATFGTACVSIHAAHLAWAWAADGVAVRVVVVPRLATEEAFEPPQPAASRARPATLAANAAPRTVTRRRFTPNK